MNVLIKTYATVIFPARIIVLKKFEKYPLRALYPTHIPISILVTEKIIDTGFQNVKITLYVTPTIEPQTGPNTYAAKTVPPQSSHIGSVNFTAMALPATSVRIQKNTIKNTFITP